MNSSLKSTILNKAKVTLRISTNAFDTEIGDIIEAGYDILKTRGITISKTELRPMELRCILTYVRSQFGDPEHAERLHNSFNEQLAQLMTTTNYTDWGDE